MSLDPRYRNSKVTEALRKAIQLGDLAPESRNSEAELMREAADYIDELESVIDELAFSASTLGSASSVYARWDLVKQRLAK